MTEAVFRDVVADAIGGGWGKDEPFEDSVPVRVIRGTDFANLSARNFDAVPLRYEARKKAARRGLRPGDILLEISGGSRSRGQSTGRTFYITQDILEQLGGEVIPASFCRRLRVDTELCTPRYAYFALQDMYKSGRAGHYEHHSTGISNFQFQYFLDAERIWLPSLDEQDRIVEVLGALDDKIELNRRMSETLEGIAATVFHSWFVAFDGAEHLEISDLGLIPEGWRFEPIGNLIEVVGGSTPSTKEPSYWEGGYLPWATPKDLSGHEGPVLLKTARSITDAGLERISSGLLPKGTLLFSSRAPIGYRAIAGQPMAVNQGFIAVPPGGELSPTYVYFWTHSNLDVITGHAGGSTFAEISKRSFRSIPAVLPPMELRHRFDEVAGVILRRCEILARESETLAELRDALLPKLISGELRISEAEQWVSEVA